MVREGGHHAGRLVLVQAGGEAPRRVTPSIRVISTGRVATQKEMACLYAACDLFVLPTLEDNLPNSVAEALCCGTPVASFSTGGLPEMVEEGENGALSPGNNPAGLAAAAWRSLNLDPACREKIARQARARYSPQNVACQHREFYSRMLAGHRQG